MKNEKDRVKQEKRYLTKKSEIVISNMTGINLKDDSCTLQNLTDVADRIQTKFGSKATLHIKPGKAVTVRYSVIASNDGVEVDGTRGWNARYYEGWKFGFARGSLDAPLFFGKYEVLDHEATLAWLWGFLDGGLIAERDAHTKGDKLSAYTAGVLDAAYEFFSQELPLPCSDGETSSQYLAGFEDFERTLDKLLNNGVTPKMLSHYPRGQAL